MYLYTISEPKTAQQLMVRLSAVEKIFIRQCTDGALDHLRQGLHSDCIPTMETMIDVQAQLNREFSLYDEVTGRHAETNQLFY